MSVNSGTLFLAFLCYEAVGWSPYNECFDALQTTKMRCKQKKCAANKKNTLQTKNERCKQKHAMHHGEHNWRMRCCSVECCNETENIWILWMLVTSSNDDHKGQAANKKDALQTKKRTLRQKREPLQSCAVWHQCTFTAKSKLGNSFLFFQFSFYFVGFL